MITQQLLSFSIEEQLPLPEVFNYLNKQPNERLESNNKSKQIALKSYLSVLSTTQQFKEYQKYNYKYPKKTLFKGLISIIYQEQPNIGNRIQHVIEVFDKLMSYFQHWQDNLSILYLQQLKQHHIERYSKQKNKENVQINPLQNQYTQYPIYDQLFQLLKLQIPVPELLYSLRVKKNKLILVWDEQFLHSLKLKTTSIMQRVEGEMDRQEILVGMLKLISENSQSNFHIISQISPLNLLTITNHEIIKVIDSLYTPRSYKVQEKQTQKVLAKPVRARLIKKLSQIYIDQIIKEKVATPEILLLLQIPCYKCLTQINVKFKPNAEFIIEMSKNQRFEEFNQSVHLDEILIQWSDSLAQLEELEIELEERFPTISRGSSDKLLQTQDLIKHLELIYDNRLSIQDQLIRMFFHTKIQNFFKYQINNNVSKTPENERAIQVLRQLQIYMVRFSDTHKMTANRIDKEICQLKKKGGAKLFEKAISAPKQLKVMEQNLRRVIRLIVNHNLAVPELLRNLKLLSVDKVKRVTLKIEASGQLIRYFERNLTLQNLLKNHFQENGIDIYYENYIKMDDFQNSNISLNGTIESRTDQEIILCIISLIAKEKHNIKDELLDIQQDSNYKLFKLELAKVVNEQFSKQTFMYKVYVCLIIIIK